ncbi:MAG: HDOD domain-containing protein [Planctomycetes bacterium]|nr:HDOD domain-containing protein [Planctomycetota bacterium]
MKTILVVDDMAILREPIAATLRLKGFKTLTAANGQEALQIAQAQKPDLILLDVAMPVMDGLTCLNELRHRPETATIPVIMLTAMSEREVVLKASQSGIAGFLLKTNFSTAELITRVQSLIGGAEPPAIKPPTALKAEPEPQPAPVPANPASRPATAPTPTPTPAHRLTKSEVLQRLENEIELRSVKPVLEYVIALTRSSTSTIDEIASAMRQDQALTVRVLRVANSSFYQRGHGAKNLMEATQRIGTTAVRNTVIAILAIDHFEQATSSGIIPLRFWEHSLATGVLAEMIGDAAGVRQADQLFLAGLLHDVGRMVLGTIYPKEYATLIARAVEQDVDLETAELETFEVSHVDVTRTLLGKWNMPPLIIEAASLHESPVATLRRVKQDAKSISAVALANRLAHALVSGNSGNARLLPYQELSAELGLNNDSIERIATGALQKTRDMEMFYAAQSSQQFCHSMAAELTKSAAAMPRIAVLGPDSPADPFSLFFNQLGWLDAVRPSVALLFPQSEFDFTKYLPALKKLDAVCPRAVATIVATADPSLSVPAEWSSGRHMERVSFPCGYRNLVETVIRAGKANKPREAEMATHH